MVVREILQMPVVHARRTNSIAIASPRDFAWEDADAVTGTPPLAAPYCLDFLHRRAIYVCDVDTHLLQAAPFYYLCLRRNARALLSVPLEHGSLRGTREKENPVFLFSPGRCGSTLLSRILYEAGIASVSEPDFYTQMSNVFWSSARNPLREPFLRAMWAMTDDLAAVLGHAPVIKLRAESCRAPALFLRGPKPRTLVMLRSFEGWAHSTARVFAPSPGKAVRKYMRALRCYAILQARSRCHLVRYEQLVAEPEPVCEALGRFLKSPIPVDAVRRAMAADSQTGTPLAARCRGGWQANFDAAIRLWRSPRLVSARATLGIPAVWD
jgi:hypothetical protein